LVLRFNQETAHLNERCQFIEEKSKSISITDSSPKRSNQPATTQSPSSSSSSFSSSFSSISKSNSFLKLNSELVDSQSDDWKKKFESENQQRIILQKYSNDLRKEVDSLKRKNPRYKKFVLELEVLAFFWIFIIVLLFAVVLRRPSYAPSDFGNWPS